MTLESPAPEGAAITSTKAAFAACQRNRARRCPSCLSQPRLQALALLGAAALALPARAATPPPAILARGGILVDAGSGKVLWQKEPDTRRPMASTTKTMTGLLVAEYGHPNEVVTVSPEAAKVGESSLHLKAGERLTMRDLLYGIMLRSANDGCVAAAEHISGSVPAFVARMNEKAAALGCANTHFVNPNGLHDPDHYTTPRDLATIARAAMQDPTFREVVATPAYTIERSINRYDRRLKARDYTYLTTYPGANGIKTGYTKQAGHCFVGAARHGQFQLISVVLHSPSINRETMALMNWGFNNFRGGVAAKPGQDLGRVRVEGGRAAEVPVTTNQEVAVTVPKDAPPVRADLSRLSVRAPVKDGQPLGVAPLMAGSEQVGEVPVIAARPVGISLWRILGRILGGTLVLLGAGVIFGAITENSRRRRRRLAARSRRLDPRGPGAREREAGRPGPERKPRR